MKRLCLLVVILSTLTSCSQSAYYEPHVNHQLLAPSWIPETNMNPNQWTKGADSWFYSGEANFTEKSAPYAPYDKAMAITAVNVPNFSKLHVEGSFQVQILGNQDKNSVYILGPQAETREIAVTFSGNTLTLTQSPDSKNKLTDVIVRIGMHRLNELEYAGCSNITGRSIQSQGLTINSHGTGRILMDGNINVSNINHDGTGTISLLGVNTRHLDLCVKGDGNVNLSGRVGLNSLEHKGNGAVRILGADSNNLAITTSGKGLNAIVGYTNLKTLTAEGDSRTYLYWVDSRQTTVNGLDNAKIGLAGYAQNLRLTLTDYAHFDGQYLRTSSVYADLHRHSHANLYAHDKAFIWAAGQSSAYFFGPIEKVSANTQDDATVIPLGNGQAPTMPRKLYRGYKD